MVGETHHSLIGCVVQQRKQERQVVRAVGDLNVRTILHGVSNGGVCHLEHVAEHSGVLREDGAVKFELHVLRHDDNVAVIES